MLTYHSTLTIFTEVSCHLIHNERLYVSRSFQRMFETNLKLNETIYSWSHITEKSVKMKLPIKIKYLHVKIVKHLVVVIHIHLFLKFVAFLHTVITNIFLLQSERESERERATFSVFPKWIILFLVYS